MPLVRPVTVAKVPLVVAVRPPGLEVTVYKLIGFPPDDIGAVQTTTTVPLALPTLAITAVGFPGAVVVVVGGQRRATEACAEGPFASKFQVESVPTCTGDDRLTSVPEPFSPVVPTPHAHKVPSVFRATGVP